MEKHKWVAHDDYTREGGLWNDQNLKGVSKEKNCNQLRASP